jgi:DNA-binding NarL/FixJ family response regulator
VISVLVVDDHPLFRDGVVAALLTADDVEVVGEAGDVAGALAAATGLTPDLVLMDLQLPDGSGVDATRALRELQPSLRVLVMTMSDDDEAVVAAMRAGARGYVVKGTGRDDVLHAVRTVAGGGAVFSPGVADRLGGLFASLAAVPGKVAFPSLTAREQEVLDLVARGYENRRIARELHLSDKTVRNHVSNVLTKLEVEDRAEAARRARNAGLGPDRQAGSGPADSSAATSGAATAAATRGPRAAEQPRRSSSSHCARVSTPSATVSRPSRRVSPTTASSSARARSPV